MIYQNWFQKWGVVAALVLFGIGTGLIGAWGILNLGWGRDWLTFALVHSAFVGTVGVYLPLYAVGNKFNIRFLILFCLFVLSIILGYAIALAPKIIALLELAL